MHTGGTQRRLCPQHSTVTTEPGSAATLGTVQDSREDLSMEVRAKWGIQVCSQCSGHISSMSCQLDISSLSQSSMLAGCKTLAAEGWMPMR